MPTVETAPGFRKAGISRYAINVVAELARLARLDKFEVYVNERFERPPEWDSSNISLHVVRKYRTHRYLACARSAAQGFHAWFVPAYDSLEFPIVPQVAMVHDMFPITHPEWFSPDQRPVMKEAIERTLRVSRTVLTNSAKTREEVLKVFPRHSANVRVTPLAIGNLAEFRSREDVTASDLRAAGVPFDRFIFALGTIEPRKNLAALIEAWSRIAPRFPDMGLVIGGAEGWESDKLLSSLGQTERVHLLGYVPDQVLPLLFAKCEFFVMASLDEGFGIPVLEAMHYGAPLVLSDRGALPELAGDAAVYFNPESVEDIARALESVPDRPISKLKMGQARASEFSWQKTASLTLDAIRNVAGIG